MGPKAREARKRFTGLFYWQCASCGAELPRKPGLIRAFVDKLRSPQFLPSLSDIRE
jgi:hypothetical protein